MRSSTKIAKTAFLVLIIASVTTQQVHGDEGDLTMMDSLSSDRHRREAVSATSAVSTITETISYDAGVSNATATMSGSGAEPTLPDVFATTEDEMAGSTTASGDAILMSETTEVDVEKPTTPSSGNPDGKSRGNTGNIRLIIGLSVAGAVVCFFLIIMVARMKKQKMKQKKEGKKIISLYNNDDFGSGTKLGGIENPALEHCDGALGPPCGDHKQDGKHQMVPLSAGDLEAFRNASNETKKVGPTDVEMEDTKL